MTYFLKKRPGWWINGKVIHTAGFICARVKRFLPRQCRKNWERRSQTMMDAAADIRILTIPRRLFTINSIRRPLTGNQRRLSTAYLSNFFIDFYWGCVWIFRLKNWKMGKVFFQTITPLFLTEASEFKYLSSSLPFSRWPVKGFESCHGTEGDILISTNIIKSSVLLYLLN